MLCGFSHARLACENPQSTSLSHDDRRKSEFLSFPGKEWRQGPEEAESCGFFS